MAEDLIMRTSTGLAPWEIVEGFDAGFRSWRWGPCSFGRMRKGLEEDARKSQLGGARGPPRRGDRKKRGRGPSRWNRGGPTWRGGSLTLVAMTTILSTLDMGKHLGKGEYKKRLGHLQSRLYGLRRRAREEGTSMVLLFEGWDAAGKGGAIRRVVRALDARFYRVIAVGAPNDEERAHHYLWRFWRHVPRAGRVTVFDRSWYGRVLVERIEGFAMEAQWMRAYAEINDFEAELVGHGVVLQKFWIHITPEEQESRFKARAQTPLKSWKLTAEDWRNRERWDAYERAVNDMVERTSTPMAPWTLIEGNDKRYARVRVLEKVCEGLEAALVDR